MSIGSPCLLGRRRLLLTVALAALVLPIVAGCAAAPSAAPTQGSASGVGASPSGAFGGSVQFTSDGAPATTVVDAVASGASMSGTAVTEFGAGTHTVQLECAARLGDTWALGGTTEQTTVHDGKAGDWSAVIVKDGSPQQIGIWVSDAKSEGNRLRWLARRDRFRQPSLPRPSCPWSPGHWCPRLIPRPDRERSQSPRRRRLD